MLLARVGVTLAFLLAAAAASAQPAEPEFTKAVPPGSEPVLLEMLGKGEVLAGSCRLEGAVVDRTFVSARYRCPAEARLELRHPAAAAGAAVTTARFAVVPRGEVPAGLAEAVAERVRAREGGWRWISVEAPGLAAAPVGPTLAVPASGPSGATAAMSPQDSEALMAAVKLHRAGRHAEARDALIELARRSPGNGVLGMLVAATASAGPTRADVRRRAAEADANPRDPLPQFVAGVSSHYYGHQAARSRAEKAEMYAQTIRFLDRTRPAYDFEPRVYVYLAVSHYRLGHQQEAEKLIEQAIPLAVNDPDVYYCRAEIRHRQDPARAAQDIERYLTMIGELMRQGVPVVKSKHERVERMLAHLRRGGSAVAATEMFDPLPDTSDGSSPLHRLLASPRAFALLALAVAVVVGGAVLVARRARRRAAG